ncbi:hypothetical protein [Streptococcus equi]|nr:hypothetical protein [Streptococcus equi]MDI6000685.1 hypothetical protein [Streptococcus equi subsp. zooepidemicus]MDI6043081.1 hypothetical protein [Streptococcus equi subsp. zooepidemicus]MDI6075805.1 hypothetical protein [Streptococcus equi subsp. zooepidemicus]WOK52827.1 hypothetical protein RIM62_07635 [Streptococcus equi subsp. zooepidemicus]
MNEPIKSLKDPQLMKQLAASGYKYNADEIILIAKNSYGMLI